MFRSATLNMQVRNGSRKEFLKEKNTTCIGTCTSLGLKLRKEKEKGEEIKEKMKKEKKLRRQLTLKKISYQKICSV